MTFGGKKFNGLPFLKMRNLTFKDAQTNFNDTQFV